LEKIVTIHQPDFMPWLGFFNKIAKTDEFIILDHTINNPKSPEFWCRRVKMLIGGKEHWMSISLKKDERQLFIPIYDMQLQMDEKTTKKFLQSVELNYKKAPFFMDTFYLVEQYFTMLSQNLVEKNVWFVQEVANKLHIDSKFIYSSQLDPQFSSNEMLIDLLKQRNATTYLCGDGAGGYQKDELYLAENILVKKNGFQHPNYLQFNTKEFVKGLSIIDALMNIGFEATEKLVKQ
jgi:WbqC-like protein family